MNDPVKYRKYNNLPRRDAREMLEEHSSKIKWKNFGDRILDIGSADGGVTMEILRRYIPNNFSKLVGCDIGENMVQYANEHYKDERTYFVKLDMRQDIPEDMKGGFDHVFSFYMIHWIRNQRVAMSNIYNLLDKDGDFLVLIVAHTPIYDIYRKLARNLKWAPWLSYAEQFISPYQDLKEPEKELRIIMEEVGFKHIDVSCQHKTFLYTDVDHFRDTIASINPFNMPKDIVKEYLDDFIQAAVEFKIMDEITYDPEKAPGLKYDYSLLIAYGSK